MSLNASTIARWNALSLARTEQSPSLKRPNDDSDDDVSLVSRSPSPSNQMAVDDDHARIYSGDTQRTSKEVITVETRIKPTNKGFAMLTKLGWVEGQPLGLSADGRVDPIPFQIKQDSSGLGKITQDVRMIETTVSQRRELDSERQQKETEEQRRAREDQVARKAALQNEISTTLKAFYCELCDKQFKTVAQYDEHTNSYAHHHKARFKDMQANARPKLDVDKRKEKERKREEKELRKLAAASGIKISKPTVTVASTAPLAPASTPLVSSVDTVAAAESNKGGWASISSSASSSGFRKSGWVTVGSHLQTSDSPGSSGWASVSQVSEHSLPGNNTAQSAISRPEAGNLHHSTAPSFRTGGWTSLDTGSLEITPPDSYPPPLSTAVPAPPSQPPPPPPPSPPSSFSPHPFSSLSNSATPSTSSWSSSPAAIPNRSSWQQFQKVAPKKR